MDGNGNTIAGEKKKIQLTFENIVVKTIPESKSIFDFSGGEIEKPKVILDNISGSILPG